MKYAIDPDSQFHLVMGTCKEEPGPIEIDYMRVRGAQFYTLEEGIKMGARITNAKGVPVWLGVNVRVKLEDKYLWFWWSGKWRLAGEWNRKTKPSNKWIQDHVERPARYNIPLDPATAVLWHWDDITPKLRPIPEDGSCSFQVNGQWYTTTYVASKTLAGTNKELVEALIARGYTATVHGNFIHLTPPDWA
jgi:hypothetical protein